ncbi:Lymphocyte antigen 6G6e [Plecturocebus cupreus]
MFQLYKSRDLGVQITSPRFLSLGPAIGTSSNFLCVLFLCGTLGLTMSPAHGRLRCYTCGVAKPCYPVPPECQDDEAFGISTGTSDQGEIIQRKGCLPRAQCPLLGHATYWLRSYTLRHHSGEQNLCNTAASPRSSPASSPPCPFSWPPSPGEDTSSTSVCGSAAPNLGLLRHHLGPGNTCTDTLTHAGERREGLTSAWSPMDPLPPEHDAEGQDDDSLAHCEQ